MPFRALKVASHQMRCGAVPCGAATQQNVSGVNTPAYKVQKP